MFITNSNKIHSIVATVLKKDQTPHPTPKTKKPTKQQEQKKTKTLHLHKMGMLIFCKSVVFMLNNNAMGHVLQSISGYLKALGMSTTKKMNIICGLFFLLIFFIYLFSQCTRTHV